MCMGGGGASPDIAPIPSSNTPRAAGTDPETKRMKDRDLDRKQLELASRDTTGSPLGVIK